ncbi:MAG: protein kinase, partial [bacterium]
ISHYKILEKLGGGGMGIVYKARDLKLERFVALKFLPPHLGQAEEEKKRFIHEAKAASALDHPNICTIYEIDETEDGQMFIAMACYEGETLKKKIERGPLPVEVAIDLACQIARGLAKAHEQDIVHRDIKPANSMITKDGVMKVVDFGLAKLSGQTKLTKEGTTLGTLAYMSPEQIQGEEVDRRTDIWSLGVILYEMLTGQCPFKGEYEQAVWYSILNEEPEPVTGLRSGLPMELERIVNKALNKNASERYQHIDEMRVDLETLNKQIKAPGTKPSQVLTSPIRRMRGYFFGAAAILFLIILVALYLFQPSRSVPADRKSIAVLPFENMNRAEESEYFSDGITEDIITQISKIADLRVISRTSSMRYKGSEKSLRDIGEELGVAFILEGSVRRAGDRVRIVGQLIDAQSDEHVWAETYDRKLADVFEIQSEVAQKIAGALQAELTSAEKQRIEKRPTENLTAYDYYLKGREYYNHYRKQDNENAIELFKKALELDPDYALAYAGLGDAYAQRAWIFGFSMDWLDSAIVASSKAISIDPNLAEGYKALGLAYEFKGWYRKALEADRKAIELNPNYHQAIANMGWVNWFIGELDEALKWMKKSLSLDPTRPMQYFGLGIIYRALDDYVRAKEMYHKALELQPDLGYAHWELSTIYLEEGKYQQALESSQKILTLNPKDFTGLIATGDVELFSGKFTQAKQYYEKAIEIDSSRGDVFARLGFILWKTGEKDQAQKMFDYCLRVAREQLGQGNEHWVIPYIVAGIYAIQGNKEEAYKWLQQAIDRGWRFYRYAIRDPLFENLHEDEQFQQMMAHVKATIDEMRKRIE